MPLALARHDALARAAVESNRGVVVKMVGDGLRAAFDEPLDALNATLAMQEALIDAGATNGVALQVCMQARWRAATTTTLAAR